MDIGSGRGSTLAAPSALRRRGRDRNWSLGGGTIRSVLTNLAPSRAPRTRFFLELDLPEGDYVSLGGVFGPFSGYVIFFLFGWPA